MSLQQPSQFPSHPSSHIVAGQEHPGQRVILHQNQPPPNNLQIQQLHEQIQKQKMQQAPPGVIMPKPSSPNQLVPPPNPYQPQPQPVMQPQHQPVMQPLPQVHSQFPAQPLNFPPPGMQPYHPPSSKPQSPPMPHPINQNYFPSNAPPIKPSSPSHPLLENSPQRSYESPQLSFEDRPMLSNPPNYEFHGKGGLSTEKDYPSRDY